MRNQTLLYAFTFKTISLLIILFFIGNDSAAFENPPSLLFDKEGKSYSVQLDCDNLTDGGAINGNETGQGIPNFDPSLITSVQLPSGGSGEIQYLWVFTQDDPTVAFAQWSPISSTNSSEFDPPSISQTTHFMRCARRQDCVDYIAESNYITKTVLICDNITNGGLIAFNQEGDAPFEPNNLTNLVTPTGGTGALEYLWLSSLIGPPYIQGSPNWTEIPNSNSSSYDPGVLSETTYFIRCVRREECNDYVGESNIVTITVNPTELECDNVLTGGMIGINQEGIAPFTPNPLVNTVPPNGGSGELEYLWFVSMTTPIYIEGSPEWTAVPNSNTPDYNPGVLNETTYFIRCVRRAGCEDYLGESNIITITVNPEIAECDNVTTGGMISINQEGDAPFTPNPLINTVSPNGGSGPLEYLWFFSTTTPIYIEGSPEWTAVPNSNTPDYSPNVLTATTYFIRCVRRAECEDYLGESNVITITVNPVISECNNVTTGGMISINQEGDAPFTPNPLINTVSPNGGSGPLEYLWFFSTMTPIYIEGSPEWTAIPNSNTPDYNPGVLNETTYFIRCARRAVCQDYLGKSNVITITVNPEIVECDNVTTGGMIGFNQESCAAFDAENLTNTINPTGGTGNLEYLWFMSTLTPIYIEGSPDWTEILNSNFPDYAPGFISETTYFIRCVRRANCEDYLGESNVIRLSVFQSPVITIDNIQNIACFNLPTGSIQITASNGTEPYSYEWDNNIGEIEDPTQLASGTYTLTVTDNNGCTVTEEVEITSAPEIVSDTMYVNPTCSGGNDGFAIVNLSGGSPPFTSQWDDEDMTQGNTLDNLAAGQYTLFTSDANGCSFSNEFVLTNPASNPIFTIEVEVQDASCIGSNNGSATVNIIETGEYTYLWNDPAGTTESTLSNASAGVYNVIVTPENGCSISQDVIIGNSTNLVLMLSSTDEICAGTMDGTASLEVQGGNPPYSIQWNDDANTTSTILENLSGGIYSVTVTDGNGCTVSGEILVNTGNGLNLDMTQQNISCFGLNDGFAIVTPLNGTAPYQYEWTNVNSDNNTASGLSPGNYIVSVTDANGCMGITGFEMSQPVGISINFLTQDVSCAEDLTNIETVISGGTSPYSYEWNTGETSPNLINVGVATYTITITDASNCSQTASVTIDYISTFTATATSTNMTCFDSNDGTATVITANTNSELSLVWSTGELGETITDLTAGTYTVTVTNSEECELVSSVDVVAPAPVLIDVTVESEITGQGENDGVAAVTATGGTGVYTYLWSNGSISATITDLSPGTYTVTVTDENGCTEIGEVTLIDGQNLTIEIGNYIWNDSNADGIQQASEVGIANIMVNLISTTTNTIVDTQTTNNQGFYLFQDVQPDEYIIQFVLSSLPENTIISPQNVGNNDLVDSDANATTGQTDPFVVIAGQQDTYSFDVGIRPKCLNVDSGGTIAGNQELCPNEIPNLITSETLPAGGSGVLEYLWLQSNTGQYSGPGDPNWSEIPNSNSPDYQAGILNETTYFVRCSRRACCVAYPGESNIVSLTVNYLPYANIENAPSSGCIDQGYTFEATAAAGSATYLWNFGTDATPQNSTTRETDNVSWSTEGDKTVSLIVTRAGCSLTDMKTVTVEDCSGFTGQFNGFAANLMEENIVSLTWQTTTNDANSIFFIEESRLGNEFETIATMEGYTNGGINVYQYSDAELFLGINHYRIRQVRSDGTSGLSDIEWVNYLPENSPEVRVFPNPFNSKFTVNVLFPQEENMLLRLMNTQGHILATEVIEAETYQRSFDLSSYPSGLYIIRVYYGQGGEVTEKLIKR